MRLRSLKYAFSFSEICVFVLQQKQKLCQLSSGEYCILPKCKYSSSLVYIQKKNLLVMYMVYADALPRFLPCSDCNNAKRQSPSFLIIVQDISLFMYSSHSQALFFNDKYFLHATSCLQVLVYSNAMS